MNPHSRSAVRRARNCALALMGPGILGACAGNELEGAGAERRERAQGATWTLEDRPMFSVTENTGTQGSRPFQIVAFTHGMPLADGRMIVADGARLVYFDTTGRATVVAGRKGAGPGEFTGIRGMFEAGDDIGVFDQQSRISLYSRAGTHIRDVRIEPGLYPSSNGWLRNSGPVTSSAPPGQQRRYSVRNANGTTTGSFVTPVPLPSFNVTWPPGTGGPALVHRQGGPPTMTPGGDRGRGSPWNECTPRDLATVIGNVLYIADQPGGRILAVAAEGSPRVIYRSPVRRAITGEILTALRRTYLQDGTPADTIDAVLKRFGNRGDPLPFAWDAILPDPTGRLWLQVAECIPVTDPEWQVIDTAGRPVATFHPGSGRALRGVRGDRVAVFTSDSLDLVYVNLFRVRQAGRR